MFHIEPQNKVQLFTLTDFYISVLRDVWPQAHRPTSNAWVWHQYWTESYIGNIFYIFYTLRTSNIQWYIRCHDCFITLEATMLVYKIRLLENEMLNQRATCFKISLTLTAWLIEMLLIHLHSTTYRINIFLESGSNMLQAIKWL